MTIVEMRQNMKLKELIHSAIKENGCGIIITSDTSYGYDIRTIFTKKKDTLLKIMPQATGEAFLTHIEKLSSLSPDKRQEARRGTITISEPDFYANLTVSSLPVTSHRVPSLRNISITIHINAVNFNNYHSYQGDAYNKLLNDLDDNGLHVISANDKHIAKDFAYHLLRDYAPFGSLIVTIEESISQDIAGVTQFKINPSQGITYDMLLTFFPNRLPSGATIFFSESETAEQMTAICHALQKGYNVLTTTSDKKAFQKAFSAIDEQKRTYHNIQLSAEKTEIFFKNDQNSLKI